MQSPWSRGVPGVYEEQQGGWGRAVEEGSEGQWKMRSEAEQDLITEGLVGH